MHVGTLYMVRGNMLDTVFVSRQTDGESLICHFC